jgi:Ni/Fe-hydrogenase subunit HybB-like protein
MDYPSLLFGILLGFMFWKLFAGKYEGDKIEKSFRFLVGNYYIHIHHWIWCLIILFVLIILNFYNSFLYGVLFGSIIQGLGYRDWYYVFYRKDRQKSIYSKFRKFDV